MPRKSSAKSESKESTTAETLAAKLVQFGLDAGLTHAEVAQMSGVTVATLHNWICGKPAKDLSLARLIKRLNVDSFDLLFHEAARLANRFDADSLKKSAHAMSLRPKYDELLSLAETIDPETSTGKSAFESMFLKRFGKELVESAINSGTRGDALVLVGVKPDDFDNPAVPRALKKILRKLIGSVEGVMLNRDVTEKEARDLVTSMQVDDFVGYTESEPHRLELLCDRFDTVERAIRDMLPNARLALRSRVPENESSLPLVNFEWESDKTSRWGEEGTRDGASEVEWLLIWLSDVNGRAVIDEVKRRIRTQMASGKRELVLEANEGYYVDHDDEDLVGINPLDHPPGELKRFQFRFGAPSEEISDDLADTSIFFESIEAPLSAEATKFFFNVLGYKARVKCNHPRKWVHQVVIRW